MQKALADGGSRGLSNYHRVMELVFFSALPNSAQLQLLRSITLRWGKVNSPLNINELFYF